MSEPIGHWQVAIVGAGPGGLGLAIGLAESGRRDFVLLEATDGVGGTWRVNTYPGAACDVPSHLYSYSFALKPDWTKTYATQPEILRYFEDCADRFGIRPHLRTGVRVEAARWDEARRRWVVTDDDGPASTRPTSWSAPSAPSPRRRCPRSTGCRPSPARRSTRPAGSTSTTWPSDGWR